LVWFTAKKRLMSAGGNSGSTAPRHLSGQRFEPITPKGVLATLFAPESNNLSTLRDKDSKWDTAQQLLRTMANNANKQVAVGEDKQCGTDDLHLFQREGLKLIQYERVVKSTIPVGASAMLRNGQVFDDDLLEMSVDDNDLGRIYNINNSTVIRSYSNVNANNNNGSSSSRYVDQSISNYEPSSLNAIPSPSLMIASENISIASTARDSTNITPMQTPFASARHLPVPLQKQLQQHQQPNQEAAQLPLQQQQPERHVQRQTDSAHASVSASARKGKEGAHKDKDASVPLSPRLITVPNHDPLVPEHAHTKHGTNRNRPSLSVSTATAANNNNNNCNNVNPSARDSCGGNLSPTTFKIGVTPAEHDFRHDLQASANPLHALYFEYKDYLSEIAKSALVRAMYHEIFLTHTGNQNSGNQNSSHTTARRAVSPRRAASPRRSNSSPSPAGSPRLFARSPSPTQEFLSTVSVLLPFESVVSTRVNTQTGDGVNHPISRPSSALASLKADANALKFDSNANHFFTECERVLIALHNKSKYCHKTMDVCEQSVQALIALSGGSVSCDADTFNHSLEASYK
jgi:hypothetical protein